MLSRLLRSSLVRAASVYGLANVIRQAIPFLLVPVLTRYLTPADYGITALFSVLISVLTPLVGINLHGALSRRYFDRDQLDFPAYVFTCISLIGLASLIVGVLMFAFGGPIAQLSEFPRTWLWTALLTASTQMIFSCTLALLQVQGRPWHYGILQIVRTLFITGLTLVLVVSFGMDWRGSVIAQLVGSIALAIASAFPLVKGGWVKPRIESAHVRHALGYGGPLIPHSLAAAATLAIDRLFVTHYAGLGQTGLYSLGYQIGMLILLLQESFNNAWQPWLFERLSAHGGDAINRKIVQFTYLYFVVILALALLLGVCAPWLLSVLVSKQFQNAYVYVLWIGLGYAFEGMYKMVGSYLFFSGRTAILSALTVTAMLVHVLFNWLLVPRYGGLGAAQATTIAFATSFVLTWIASSRIYPMPWLLALSPSSLKKRE